MDSIESMIPPAEQEILERVDAFATEAIDPYVETMERDDVFPVEVIDVAEEYGILELLRDEQYGGHDVDFLTYSRALERISEISCALGETIGHHAMTTMGIERFGTPEQKERYLGETESVGSLMLSEPGAGSSPSDLEAVAQADGDHFILNGTKRFCTNASFADVCVVVARKKPTPPDSHGVSAFLVPGVENTDGLRFDRMKFMGMRGHITGDAHFDDVRVPKDALLGDVGDGFKIAMSNIDLGRTGLAVMATGVARSAFDLAIDYATDREQGGSPIGEYQSVQLMAAEMDAKLDAARHLAYQSAASISEGAVDTHESAKAKFYATEAAEEITRDAMQIYGGRGYSKEYPLEQYFRDARGLTILGGTSEIQKTTVAKQAMDM
jgi:alkylation response protein AidB-like acyl-CoA dehydrogenase